MSNVTDWHGEVQRQGQRLETDLVSRQVGIFLSCVLFFFFLPFWVVFLVYLGTVLCDIVQARLIEKFVASGARGKYSALLTTSFFGLAIYSVPSVLLWQSEDLFVGFIGVLALIGALLNVSVMRSTHLMFGLTSGLPPALALLWMPLHYVLDFEYRYHAALASAGVIVLLGYFLSALVQNNRAQKQLIAASETDREARHEKTRLLKSLGHEVRTPLNSILGHSQLLRQEEDRSAMRRQAGEIEIAARNMQMLVEDVLDLASVSENEIAFRPVTSVIRRELDRLRLAKVYGPATGAAAVTIEVEDEVPEIGRFDPVLLRRCLGGLAAIALSEHKDGSPPELSVRCTLAPGRRDRLRLALVAAVPDSEANPIAPVTAQPDAPRFSDQAGLRENLAKSLVEGLAAIMGARVSMLRLPDNSIVTRIELPFVTVPEPPSTGAEQVYGRLKVLVVDDIASNRLVITQLLRSLRIDAVEAPSGQDALDLLSMQRFDLILLDMNMPDMDGEATFAAIRSSDAGWSKTPVIAVTADAPARERESYTSIGIDGYLSKPVDRNLLWAEIVSVVPPPPPL